MKSILISKSNTKLVGSILLPTSKSLSNRLLMIRALAGIDFPISGLSDAHDTVLLEKLLTEICRTGGMKKVTELDTQNAGTVIRFLTACLAMRPGKWVLTGSDRMKQRPIGILVEALRSLGADIDFLAKPGYPPILIRGKELTGSEVTIDPGESSQYVSALLMIAPNLPHGLTIHFKGKTVSTPYMDMTIGLMKQQGAKVRAGKHGVTIKPGGYRPVEAVVEGDWSAAAFWYEAAVLAGEVDLELKGLRKESMQGDSLLAAICENFGVDTTYTSTGIRLTRNRQKIDGFFFNFNDHPDIAPAVIVTCAVMGIRGHFEGLKSLIIKESDRLAALKSELEKLGLKVDIPDRKDDLPTLDFKPTILKTSVQSAIETYGDHRMAMTFAPLAIRLGPIRINNPDVVGKSYPQFWDHLKELGFKVDG